MGGLRAARLEGMGRLRADRDWVPPPLNVWGTTLPPPALKGEAGLQCKRPRGRARGGAAVMQQSPKHNEEGMGFRRAVRGGVEIIGRRA